MNAKSNQLCLIFFSLFFCSPVQLFAYSCKEQSQCGEEEDIKITHFPDGFFFGTATSAYQTEGASSEDGKGLSNWDVFTQHEGSRRNGANGDVANNHYHQYLEDIELVNSLGVSAYRFSISWTRILPRGRFGEVNSAGIKFYNNVIDNLLLKGIEPFVTINHNDFPQELEERYGSWLSPLMQDDFVYFAETCFRSFGDRVKYWITINEPNMFAEMAYIAGDFPPAHCSAPSGKCPNANYSIEHLTAVHNMLLAHAKAVKLYRQLFQSMHGGSIGIVVLAFMYEPMTDSELDKNAAKRAMAFDLAWIFDPIIFGEYPQEMQDYHGNNLPKFSEEEKECLKGSTDFIGLNHYSTLYAKDCIYSSCVLKENDMIVGFSYISAERDGVPIGEPSGMPDMSVVPRGMEEIIDYVSDRYHNKPMFVLENGYAQSLTGGIQVQDLINDVKRVEFHKAYLSSLAKAIRKGADVRGYFIWALMDVFEWLDGYSIGFGLHYVDRQTLQRIPKLSATWYTNFLTNTSGHTIKKPINRRSAFISRNVSFKGVASKHLEM